MNKCILLALILSVSIWCFAGLNVTSEIAKLDQSGRNITIGQDDEVGVFILCKESVVIEAGDTALALETAKLQARANIAEFISIQVKSTSRSVEQTTVEINGEEEAFSSNDFIKRCMRKDAQQIQRGIAVCSVKEQSSQLTVYCLLVENVLDATEKMKKSMEKLGPDTVQAMGMSFISETVNRALASKNAVAEAQREAIAQVLGTSVVSSSARQTISSNNIDNEGNEMFACDDTFKAKVFSSSAGFIESCRIINEEVVDNSVIVTIVAKVSRKKLQNDYRSYLESMGNPGFCVRSNNAKLLDSFAGFFGGLGLRMVDNLYDAAYIIDAKATQEGNYLHVSVVVRDKISKEALFSMDNNPVDFPLPTGADVCSACSNVLNSMKQGLHERLDTFIGRANADGRKVIVKLTNYDSSFKSSAQTIEKALKMVPGASNVRMKISEVEYKVEYTLNFRGETEDLADFLEKQIKTDIKRRKDRPVRSEVKNTLVEFNFE